MLLILEVWFKKVELIGRVLLELWYVLSYEKVRGLEYGLVRNVFVEK